MTSLQSVQQAVLGFKNLVDSKRYEEAWKLASDLKGLVLSFESLPPLSFPTPNAFEEKTAALVFLEYAVILSVEMADKEEFQKYIACLRPFYSDRSIAASFTQRHTITGLYLLYLLVENKLTEFHCELELLNEVDRAHPAVAFCTKLDQHLMVGSYDQVLAAASSPPFEHFKFFLTSLLETVRVIIGHCAASSYKVLSIESAREILMFQTHQETREFISSNFEEWIVNGDAISLVAEASSNRIDAIPSVTLIQQNLGGASIVFGVGDGVPF